MFGFFDFVEGVVDGIELDVEVVGFDLGGVVFEVLDGLVEGVSDAEDGPDFGKFGRRLGDEVVEVVNAGVVAEFDVGADFFWESDGDPFFGGAGGVDEDFDAERVGELGFDECAVRAAPEDFRPIGDEFLVDFVWGAAATAAGVDAVGFVVAGDADFSGEETPVLFLFEPWGEGVVDLADLRGEVVIGEAFDDVALVLDLESEEAIFWELPVNGVAVVTCFNAGLIGVFGDGLLADEAHDFGFCSEPEFQAVDVSFGEVVGLGEPGFHVAAGEGYFDPGAGVGFEEGAEAVEAGDDFKRGDGEAVGGHDFLGGLAVEFKELAPPAAPDALAHVLQEDLDITEVNVGEDEQVGLFDFVEEPFESGDVVESVAGKKRVGEGE